MEVDMTHRVAKYLFKTALLFALVSCGGGGGGGNSAPPPPFNGVVVLAPPTMLDDGTAMGTAGLNGSTSAQGQPVDGMTCTAPPGGSYSYVHLSIYHNSQLLSLPQDIGVVLPIVGM